jgi:hypothetical protein
VGAVNVQKFEEVLVGVNSLTEAQTALESLDGVRRVIGNLHFRNGQVAWLTLPFSSTPLADALRFMNNIGVHAAPKLVSLRDLPSGESVVVYEIPGLPEVYPSLFSGPAPLPKEAAERLRQDFELMFATGYVHPLAVAGYDTWRIVHGTGSVVFERWETLRVMTADEIDDARASAERLIRDCEI